MKLSEA